MTITFSEKVTGLTNAALTVANGSLSAVSTSDGGITWTATLTPDASITDTSNVITLDNSAAIDLSGNAGSGSTDSNTYAVDTARPTASIVVADSALSVGESSLVTITFSEKVTGLTNAALTVANGSLSAVGSIDGGLTWTATFTPASDITETANVITLDNSAAIDLSGNAGSGTTDSNTYAVDTARPTASIVVADSSLSAGETSLVTITFSEAVSGFTNAALQVANGTLTPVSTTDSGVTWTATFTPDANLTDASNVITLDNSAVRDAAGNTGSGTTDSNNYAIDTARPIFSAAAVVSNQLVLSYIETTTLDAAHPPGIGAFAVTTNGAANPVTGVAVDAAAKTVTLTLTTAVAYSQAVTVAYTDPTAGNDVNAIQDAAGNDAASFGPTVATNSTSAPPTPTPPLPEPVEPTPTPPTPAGDKDGIPPAMEDSAPGIPGPGGAAPIAGDGNGDGIKDSLQAEVASTAFVLSPTSQSQPGSAPATFVTLVTNSLDGKVDSASPSSRITSFTQKDAPANLPEGLEMPMGLVSFTAELLNGASSESFSLYVDASLGINGYWKQDSTGTWANLASEPYGGKTVLEGGRLRLDFQIADGGEFDADGKVDGIITDPGAPAYMPLSIVGLAPEVAAFWF